MTFYWFVWHDNNTFITQFTTLNHQNIGRKCKKNYIVALIHALYNIKYIVINDVFKDRKTL